jgi:hypothetical protein
MPGEERLLSIQQMAISTPLLPYKLLQPLCPAARVKECGRGESWGTPPPVEPKSAIDAPAPRRPSHTPAVRRLHMCQAISMNPRLTTSGEVTSELRPEK